MVINIDLQNYIVLLVGKSGSGKTTIAHMMRDKDGFVELESYTTRPARENDSGHIFVNDADFKELALNGNMVCHAEFDGYQYGATLDQINSSDVYVIDPDGVETFKANYTGVKKPIIMYLECGALKRYRHMRKRGDSPAKALKRLWHDHKYFKENVIDFSEPNCFRCFANQSVETVYNDVMLSILFTINFKINLERIQKQRSVK